MAAKDNFALPASPLASSLDPEAQSKTLGAYESIIRSLEERNKPNYFALSQAFFNPGKTGSFGEAAGNVAGALAKDQEQQQERAPNIAMMRAQLEQGKYKIQNQTKAMQMLGYALGEDPQTVARGLTSGSMPEQMQQKMKTLDPKVIIAITATDPEVGALAKEHYTLTNEGRKTDIAEQTLAETQRQHGFSNQIEELKVQQSYAELQIKILQAQGDATKTAVAVSDFIDKVGPKEAAKLGIKPMVPPVFPNPSAPNLPSSKAKLEEGQVMAAQPQAAPAAELSPAPSDEIALLKEGQVATGGDSPAVQRAIQQKAAEAEIERQSKEQEARTKPYLAKHDIIAAHDYNTYQLNDAKYGELIGLTKNNPDVVAMLTHQGPMYALLQAAESGIDTPVGRLNVPVSEALTKLKLTPEKQAVARNIMQLMSDLNQEVMKNGKSIFGPSISTFDAQKMAEPGFKMTDPAQFITYLAAKNKIVNKYMNEMYETQLNYFESHPKATTASFFKSSDYKSVVDRMNATYRDLVSKSPFGR
jgi:hypothetical protein